MPAAPFIPSHQPDVSIGRRYAKAFKYLFAMLREGEDLLSVDTSSATTAGSLIDEGRFAVIALPREIQFREPFATVVTVMQDGGKVVESNGQVLRLASIAATTGFLPPSSAVGIRSAGGRSAPDAGDLDSQLGAVSGYYAFMKIRYLFRQYGDALRRGDRGVAMYFFDYKNDDFWRIEPESFDATRSSRRPMSYDFNIPFKCLELADPVVSRDPQAGAILGIPGLVPSNARVNTNNVGGVVSKVAGGFSAASKSSILTTVSRLGDMVTSGLGFLKFCDVVVQRAFQFALNKADNVVRFFADAHDTFFTLLDTVPILLAQLSSSLAGLFRTIDEFAPDNIASELNEWSLEVTRMTDFLSVQVGFLAQSQSQRDVKITDQGFSQGRLKQGSTTDLMQEAPGSPGAPDANPFIGASGLALVTDVDGLSSARQYVSVTINRGEDIYALARRVFGDIARFVDLVLINKLEFPFIVADAGNKPANTLAWGEGILIPSRGIAQSTVPDAGAPTAAPTASGTVSSGAPLSQLIDAGASWLPDQWVGYSVTASNGGTQQTLICNGNTATQLTLSGTWSITITPGVTQYAIARAGFEPGRPVTPETRAYGVDLRVAFGADGQCDIVFDAASDIAVVRGLDNLVQALTLRSRCPLGEHPFHRTYGMLAPVGRPIAPDVGVLYAFFARRSLLADPRVGKVRNVQLDQVGNTLQMRAEVQPVDSRAAQPISVRIGA